MSGKYLKLSELAHVFHGIGNADLFNEEKLKKTKHPVAVTECRVLRAVDINTQRPWITDEGIGTTKVSTKKVESEKRRGRGQSFLLMQGDILISTRGTPKVSPLVTHRIIKDGPVVAGPEVIVIRAKEGTSAAALRDAIKSPEAADYLHEYMPRKAANGSGVLSKEVACGLPLPSETVKAEPRFGEQVEMLSHKAEQLLERLKALNHAIVDGARWRSDDGTSSSTIARFDNDAVMKFSWEMRAREVEHDIARRANVKSKEASEEWVMNPSKPTDAMKWRAPFIDEEKALSCSKELWAAEAVEKILIKLGRAEADDDDTMAACKLLSPGGHPADAAKAICSEDHLLEKVTHLVHRGDLRASSTNVGRSIRRLLAECSAGHDSAIVMSAETGHLASAVLKRDSAMQRLCLIEKHAPYARTSRALCGLISKGTEIECAEEAFRMQKRAYEIAVYEASGTETNPAETDEAALQKSKDAFQWHSLRDRLSPGGMLVAHIPPSHWELLMSVKDSVRMILQLPPVRLPLWNEASGLKYAPCEQGLMVVIRPEAEQQDPVKLVDATRLNGSKPGDELSADQIRILTDILTEKTEPTLSMKSALVERGHVFSEPRVWPSLPNLIRNTACGGDLKRSYTLETLVEEVKYTRHQLDKIHRKMFQDMGLQANR